MIARRCRPQGFRDYVIVHGARNPVPRCGQRNSKRLRAEIAIVSGCASISFAAEVCYTLENLRRDDDTINAIAGPEPGLADANTAKTSKPSVSSLVDTGQAVPFVVPHAVYSRVASS